MKAYIARLWRRIFGNHYSLPRAHFFSDEAWCIAQVLAGPPTFSGLFFESQWVCWDCYCTGWGWIGICKTRSAVLFADTYGHLLAAITAAPKDEEFGS